MIITSRGGLAEAPLKINQYPMRDDPIVAEARRIREEHTARFGYDLDLIVEYPKAQEKASDRQYIELLSRRLADQKAETN